MDILKLDNKKIDRIIYLSKLLESERIRAINGGGLASLKRIRSILLDIKKECSNGRKEILELYPEARKNSLPTVRV